MEQDEVLKNAEKRLEDAITETIDMIIALIPEDAMIDMAILKLQEYKANKNGDTRNSVLGAAKGLILKFDTKHTGYEKRLSAIFKAENINFDDDLKESDKSNEELQN